MECVAIYIQYADQYTHTHVDTHTHTVVELVVTSYTVSESDKVVEVCVNVVDSTPCPSTLSFTVTLSTCDQTAGMYTVQPPIMDTLKIGQPP